MAKRVPYCTDEDDELWKYVNVTNTEDSVSGRTLWTKLEQTKLLPGRSWQSLKERCVPPPPSHVCVCVCLCVA